MKVINSNLENINFIRLHDSNFLEKFRYAGKVVSETLVLLEDYIKNNQNISTLDLDRLAENYILNKKCIPTFKNYGSGSHGKPFPSSVCISVNNIMVHGVPSDYILQDGDKISLDLGATFDGAIADSAITLIYGHPKKEEHIKLIDACKKSLYKGISAVKLENKIGAIGNAIYKSAKNDGFNVITQYGGHSISMNKPHSDPFVPNKSSPEDGPRMQSGLVLAIEPQLIFGSTHTYISNDGWSVVAKDITAHFEHSVYLHSNNTVEVLTKRPGENYENIL